MRLLFFLLFYFGALFASCSNQIGKVQINEVFVGKSGVVSSENWIEIKIKDSSIDSSKWSVQISESASKNSYFLLSADFTKNNSYITSVTPIKISRNSNEQTNITLFDENNDTIDSLTIYGNGGNPSYMPTNQTCAQFNQSNASVNPNKVTVSSYFDVVERLGDEGIWVSWKDSGSKGLANTNTNNSGNGNGYTIAMYNTSSKKLKTVVAGDNFDVTIETSADLVDSNRILVVGSDDGCNSQNINLSCSQVNLLGGALTATLVCSAPDEYYEKVWLKLYDGRNSFCSDDTFTIRPASFVIEAPAKALAGENSTAIKALSSNGVTTSKFARSVDAKGSSLIASCPNPNPLNSKITMLSGAANIIVDDVGDINITIASVVTNDECVANSSQNFPDANGLVGCEIAGGAVVGFVPYELVVSNITLTPQTGLTQTYIYSDDLQNMSARAGYKISAKSKNTDITKNYSAGCYEKPIKITPAITQAKLQAMFDNPFSDFSLANFSNGVLDISATDKKAIKFNFVKPTVATEPFDINQTELKLTVTDSNGTKGTIGEAPSSSVRFVYGRSSVTKTPDNSLFLNAEIYSKNSPGDSYKPSLLGGNYWINSDDSITVFSFTSSNQAVKPSAQSTTLTNGSANITLTNQSNSYQKSQIIVITTPWLSNTTPSDQPTCQIYPCESVEFFPTVISSTWSGKSQKSMGAMPLGARKRGLN